MTPFKKLTPADSTLKFFGAGAEKTFPDEFYFDGENLETRLRQLAAELSIGTTRELEDPDEVSSGGDAGLDWIAIRSFSDETSHQPVFFAQCACGANWIDKQHEARFGKWRKFMVVRQSIQCIHFVPRSFRRTNFKWHRATMIEDELVLIDRFRLISLMSELGDGLLDLLAPYEELLAQKLTMKFY